MSNQFAKNVAEYFDKVVEGYDANTVLSQRASKFTPPAIDMQRAGNTFWRPQPYVLKMNPGFDTSATGTQDLIQLSVPASLSQRGNVEIKLTSDELRDTSTIAEAAKAAQLAIAATVDMNVADCVAQTGSLVIRKTGPIDWDLCAAADSMMSEQGVKMGSARSLILGSTNYNAMASSLGAKQFHQGETKSAYDEARLPNIASFQSFQTDYPGYVNGSGATGIKLGADADYVPVATKSDNLGGDNLVDNRSAPITVSKAGLVAGDAFTIDGVWAVHHIKKTKTNQLKTFRVISVTGTTAVISPPVISTGPYQNVSNKGSSGAAINILNTTGGSPVIFWRDSSIEIINGSFAGLGSVKGGAEVMTATSKSGLPLAMLYWFDGPTVTYKTKWLAFYGVNNLNSEMNGIILPNQ